ncbi:MAG: RidA family protein [Firmicutes bacterium]|nr:RidA family protein [Bacillota bacterium]
MIQTVATEKAPGAIGPYSQAKIVNGMVYTSGQLGMFPNGNLPEGVQAQAIQSLTNVKNILEAAGSSMDKVVKTTVFIKDMNDFGKVNEIYGTFFTEGAYPARSCVEVARLPKDALVEIEVVAEL